jgi:hypothetical protein
MNKWPYWVKGVAVVFVIILAIIIAALPGEIVCRSSRFECQTDYWKIPGLLIDTILYPLTVIYTHTQTPLLDGPLSLISAAIYLAVIGAVGGWMYGKAKGGV